jgi:hypothetical protein
MYRRLDWHLRQALRGKPAHQLPLDAVAVALAARTGFALREQTIRGYNTRQVARHGVGPLLQVEGGGYQLNEAYYSLLGSQVRARSRPGPVPAIEHSTPEYRRSLRQYNTRYQRTMRHLDRYVEQLLGGKDNFSIEEMVTAIRSTSGFEPGPATMGRRLRRYIEERRRPEIEEAGQGLYRRAQTRGPPLPDEDQLFGTD